MQRTEAALEQSNSGVTLLQTTTQGHYEHDSVSHIETEPVSSQSVVPSVAHFRSNKWVQSEVEKHLAES